MARVGVMLSGCGVFDGAEIHEAVFTMLALDEAGAEYVWIAPDIEQMHVIDHRTGDTAGEKRNVLTEAARIARGKIRDLAAVSADELDALVFPGGFGVAKNLCDFAVKGADCKVHPGVADLVMAMYRAKKPLGFACISPALAAAVFRDAGVKDVRLTLGQDGTDAAKAIAEMGAIHVPCPVDEARTDGTHRVVSTPAYMYDDGKVSAIRTGIKQMVEAVLSMAG